MFFDSEVLAWVGPGCRDDRIQVLRAQGLVIRMLPGPEAVIDQVMTRTGPMFTPVLLAGLGPESRDDIGRLRAYCPQASIVVLASTDLEGEQLALLRLDVDWICSPESSPGLVTAVLLHLWRRHLGRPVEAAPRSHQGWILREYAWALESPCGARVSLSVGERTALTLLFSAPDLTASHANLRRALEEAYGYPEGLGRGNVPSRLGLLFNRLRTKGRRLGLDIPIHAVRGHGYGFGVQASVHFSPSSCPIAGL